LSVSQSIANALEIVKTAGSHFYIFKNPFKRLLPELEMFTVANKLFPTYVVFTVLIITASIKVTSARWKF